MILRFSLFILEVSPLLTESPFGILLYNLILFRDEQKNEKQVKNKNQ